jgi:hypothetical protein
MSFTKILLLISTLISPGLVLADACRAVSGAGTGALVELYTSEGCSSCPPAERWLGTLASAEIAAGRLVPLALHVGYWDHLGWKDPYAQPAFVARQQAIRDRHRARSIYTPQVVVAGRDFREWYGFGFASELKRIQAQPARATLALSLDRSAAGGPRYAVESTVPNPADRPDAELYLALTESGLSNQVKAGENRGETLHHAHVVRRWHGPISFDARGVAVFNANTDAATAAIARSGQAGVAAFVQNRATGAVLQAVALRACTQ